MYQPPVAEYKFLIENVVNVEHILADIDYGDLSVDDISDILSHAGEFAAEVLAPLNPVGDREGLTLQAGQVCTPAGFREAYRSFIDAGWVSMAAPRSAGGEGIPLVVAAAAREFWTAANFALALCPSLSEGALWAIAAAADEDIKSIYLPPLVNGEWTGTMNLTEPQSGTDLAGITTHAHETGDGAWLVSGQKIFISWGDHDMTDNIVHLVLARTPDAPPGLGGLSLFLVPKWIPRPDGTLGRRNAVETVSIEHKLGIHASPKCVLSYDRAIGYLIGQRHQGLMAMFVMMNIARQGTGIQALAVADRAYQDARRYAAERIQGAVLDRPAGTPIAEHPDVRRLLLSMSSTLTAIRAVSVQISAWLDLAASGQSEPRRLADFLLPVFKGWATESGVQVTSDAIQVHGGTGYIEETGVAQYYRDIRILPIWEGTTAVQAKDLIGRKVLRDNGELAGHLFDLVSGDAELLDKHDSAIAHRVAGRLRAAVTAAQVATLALLDQAPRDQYAASVPYLTLLGVLAGGWMHARIVTRALDSDDDQQTARRLREADFYTAYQLSQAAALGDIIKVGEIA
jgi:alkylation response protein AidB-like acyl-CoA dehydrogenase